MPQATDYPDPALERGSNVLANLERQSRRGRLGGRYIVATGVKPAP